MAKGMTFRSIQPPATPGERGYLKGKRVELVSLRTNTRRDGSSKDVEIWEDNGVEPARYLDFPEADEVVLTRENGTKIRLRYRPRNKNYVQADDVEGGRFDIRFHIKDDGVTKLPPKEVSEWDIASPAKLRRLYLQEVGVELIVLYAKIAETSTDISQRIKLSEYLTALLRLQRRISVQESDADVRGEITAAIKKHLGPHKDHIVSTRLDC